VVMGGYAAAQAVHVSGPVAMAVAGLIMGNQGVRYAMSETARDYVVKFWQVIDEILNAVLFLLIGLEAIAVWRESRIMLFGLLAIPLVLLARFVSVGMPLLMLHRIQNLGPAAVPILWWGGLRGGISIALALSIPKGQNQELILAATYAVVVFSVLVQGSTIGRLARRYRLDEEIERAEEAHVPGRGRRPRHLRPSKGNGTGYAIHFNVLRDRGGACPRVPGGLEPHSRNAAS
jgi:sodium/proton antiporter, CPA1 family (TC 2.A.36)